MLRTSAIQHGYILTVEWKNEEQQEIVSEESEVNGLQRIDRDHGGDAIQESDSLKVRVLPLPLSSLLALRSHILPLCALFSVLMCNYVTTQSVPRLVLCFLPVVKERAPTDGRSFLCLIEAGLGISKWSPVLSRRDKSPA
jgi:hypothetical protein